MLMNKFICVIFMLILLNFKNTILLIDNLSNNIKLNEWIKITRDDENLYCFKISKQKGWKEFYQIF